MSIVTHELVTGRASRFNKGMITEINKNIKLSIFVMVKSHWTINTNATFNNILAISCLSGFIGEKSGIPRENH
jgi:uncharacterized membrane protein